MLFPELVIALIFGTFCGIFTGLTPGVHVNLVSVILVSVSGYLLGFFEPVTLCVFIVAMAVTHTFLDAIPSIFLGAPDEDMALAVLPGHKLLLEGKGFEAVKLATIGSLLCLVMTAVLVLPSVYLLPPVYGYIEPYIGLILVFVMVFMILSEKTIKEKIWGLGVFLISGVLGLAVFAIPDIEQPLLPMLSGLFGISTLLLSLMSKTKIPEQKITETIEFEKKTLFKSVSTGTFTGMLAGMFPGLGSAQSAIIASTIAGNLGNYAFMVIVGGINTVNFMFSLVAVYTIEKARNGAVVAMIDIVNAVDRTTFIILCLSAVIVGGVATFLTMYMTRVFAKLFDLVDYKKLSIGIMIFVTLLVFYFSSWIGLLVLFTSTAIGIIPTVVKVKKSLAMGCLLLPVILYFVM